MQAFGKEQTVITLREATEGKTLLRKPHKWGDNAEYKPREFSARQALKVYRNKVVFRSLDRDAEREAALANAQRRLLNAVIAYTGSNVFAEGSVGVSKAWGFEPMGVCISCNGTLRPEEHKQCALCILDESKQCFSCGYPIDYGGMCTAPLSVAD